MLRHPVLTAWAISLCVSLAGAQTVARKEPVQYTGKERASRVEARPPGIRLSLHKPTGIALAPLSVSEAARLVEPGTRMRTGVHRSLGSNALAAGAWETTADGTRVWRMAVGSPASVGIRIEFRNFSVGSGKVWVHDGTNVAGPYTGAGPFDNGHFWSAAVLSESVILEYEPALDASAEETLPFEIQTISHQAKSPARAASFATTTTDPADYCHLDPNCYADWKPAMSMVGQLIFEEDGDEYLCSGSLVGTRDNSLKPYLLTAGHCIHSEDSARSLEVFWTYQTSTCGGTAPDSRESSTKSTLGGNLIDYATIENGDYSLVLLKDIPSGVTFSGWDVADPAVATPLAGLHHPKGSWKRISFGERTSDQTVTVDDATAPGDKYLELLLEKGRIEPGSSGSPLFSSPGVIVGTLTYGPSSDSATACEIEPFVAGYGRFSTAYASLKDYLENLPAAEVTPGTASLAFTVSNGAAPAAQTVQLSTASTGTSAYKLRADATWIKLASVSGTVSAGAPAKVSVTVDPAQFDAPGQYASTVTILSGAADPQYINVTATVRVDQSNVAASVSPNPVVQSGGYWSFKIRLVEGAGAATQLTSVKLNGTDYSSYIKSWFGTDHIDAKGSIVAPLQAGGRYPSGTQYFEFRGVDELSGLHWYRTATVRFQ